MNTLDSNPGPQCIPRQRYPAKRGELTFHRLKSERYMQSFSRAADSESVALVHFALSYYEGIERVINLQKSKNNQVQWCNSEFSALVTNTLDSNPGPQCIPRQRYPAKRGDVTPHRLKAERNLQSLPRAADSEAVALCTKYTW